MNIKSLVRNSRLQVSVILLVVWVVSLFENFQAESLYVPLIILVVGLVVDRLLRRLVQVRATPFSSLVTVLLVAFVISPQAPVWIGLVAVTLAFLAKYLIRSRRQWFNPAAFGIFVASLVFGLPADWWIMGGSSVGAVVLVVGMIYVLYKLQRLWLPATFLLVYYVWFLLWPGGFELALLLDGTILLFALVMLAEPRTSPNLGIWRYGFGLLVVGLVIGIDFFQISASFDLLLAALLLANVLAFFVEVMHQRIKKQRPAAEAA